VVKKEYTGGRSWGCVGVGAVKVVELGGTYTHPGAQTHFHIANANEELACNTLGRAQDQVTGLAKELFGLLCATRGKQTCR
jgi:hypothetical protein